MKALLLSAPQRLTLETVPDPQPAAHEAVVRVERAGICGTDVELFVNEHMLHYTMGYAKLPIIPGHEWTGTVAEVGREVTDLRPGDAVCAEVAIGCGACRFCRQRRHNVCPDRREVGIVNQNGGFAELACVPAANLHKTAGLAPRRAALAEPTAVSLNGCRQARVGAGERVLVVGAGPIGLLSLQCAHAAGAAEVTVLDREAQRLAMAERLGARILDGSTFDPAKLPEQAKGMTAGEGFDVILECAGAGPLFPHLLPALARLGRLAVVGCFGEQRPAINPDLLMAGERSIVGAVGGGTSYPDAIALIRSGRVQAEPLVTHELALHEVPGLLEQLAQRRGPAGMLKPLVKP